MATRDVLEWETSISRVVSEGAEEEVIVRGHRLSDLIGRISFAEMMFLLLRGDLATPARARVLDALLVASAEHGIAPPSMVSRCFASRLGRSGGSQAACGSSRSLGSVANLGYQ
jgi:citrate synthase